MPRFDPLDAFAELVVCVVFHLPRHPRSPSHVNDNDEEVQTSPGALRGVHGVEYTGYCLYHHTAPSLRGSGTWLSQRGSAAELGEVGHGAAAYGSHSRVLSQPSRIPSFVSVGSMPFTTACTPVVRTHPHSPGVTPTVRGLDVLPPYPIVSGSVEGVLAVSAVGVEDSRASVSTKESLMPSGYTSVGDFVEV